MSDVALSKLYENSKDDRHCEEVRRSNLKETDCHASLRYARNDHTNSRCIELSATKKALRFHEGLTQNKLTQIN
ncbi:MAG: hypothetical protein DI539_13930 [Flavobacterium psychrophilum]|nr:MAG: hypothetical protein DI539_13930 [Flavobacterium psychrophilum]